MKNAKPRGYGNLEELWSWSLHGKDHVGYWHHLKFLIGQAGGISEELDLSLHLNPRVFMQTDCGFKIFIILFNFYRCNTLQISEGLLCVIPFKYLICLNISRLPPPKRRNLMLYTSQPFNYFISNNKLMFGEDI